MVNLTINLINKIFLLQNYIFNLTKSTQIIFDNKEIQIIFSNFSTKLTAS